MTTWEKLTSIGERLAGRPPTYYVHRLGMEWHKQCGRLLWKRALAGRSRLTEAVRASPLVLPGREPTLYLCSQEIDAVLAILSARDQGYRRRVLDVADRIADNKLTLFSYIPVEGGQRIRWNLDYLSGRSWPGRYAFDYDLVDYQQPSDIRIAWELNRLQFLWWLGKAYRLTKDPRYAQRVRELIESWDEANPVGYSLAWACSMEVSLRAVSLMLASSLCGGASAFDSAFALRLTTLLILHGRYIRHHLEYSDIRGNHYLADVVGLVHLGIYLSPWPEAGEWLAFGTRELTREIELQIHEDGVDHEGSIAYHRLVTEFFFYTAVLLKRHGVVVPETYWQRLQSMLDFTAAYTRSDGTAPNLGDNDDGRMMPHDPATRHDHRYLIAAGAVVFGRQDFAIVAGQLWEDVLWVLGPSAEKRFRRPGGVLRATEPGSVLFPCGGFAVSRGRGDHLIFDFGEVGGRGRGGHGHNDVLSFELYMCGRAVVVDCGCALYTRSLQARVRSIATRSHNTVVVDGEEIAPLRWYHIPSGGRWDSRLICLAEGPDQWRATAEHSGYRRLKGDIIHRRTMIHCRGARCFRIVDEFAGQGRHALEGSFHLHPACTPLLKGGGVMLAFAGGGSVFVSGDHGGEWRVEPADLYRGYGETVGSHVLRWSAEDAFPSRHCVTFQWLGDAD